MALNFFLCRKHKLGISGNLAFQTGVWYTTYDIGQTAHRLYRLAKGGMELAKENTKTIAQNRKAYHDYFVIESYEAGIELEGTEVKSIRRGSVNLKDSWADIKDGELFAIGMHISPYEQGNIFNKDPLRPRKLLMHKREIARLYGQVKQMQYTLVPLSLYFKGSRVKVQLGLCKGKKQYDKREDMARRDAKRDIDRTLKERNLRG